MAKASLAKAPVRRNDNSPDRSRERAWYLDKRISLDTIVQVVGMAVVLGGPFVLWARAMEQAQALTAGRIATMETVAAQRDKFEEARDAESKRRQQEMAQAITKLDERLQGAQSEFQRQLVGLQLQMGQLINSVKK